MSGPALRGTCVHCGEPVVRYWTSDGTDFGMWIDESSANLVGEPSALATAESFKGSETDAGVQMYHWALVAFQMHFPMPWQHRHEANPSSSYAGLAPDCCGWPMQRVRDGWLCRQDRTHFGKMETAA